MPTMYCAELHKLVHRLCHSLKWVQLTESLFPVTDLLPKRLCGGSSMGLSEAQRLQLSFLCLDYMVGRHQAGTGTV